MKILLLAGEESGVVYANALKASASLRGAEIRGYDTYGFKTEDLAVFGFLAVLKRIFFFLRVKRTLERAIDEWRPDAVCTIDYPGMNLKLAAYAKKRGIRTVHVVCPQVWAWKAGRIPKIEAALDRLCCFFPFEPRLFKPGFATFVGHPLAASFGAAQATEAGLVAALPGSRLGEIERHLPLMLAALKNVKGARRIVVPAANGRAEAAIRRIVAANPAADKDVVRRTRRPAACGMRGRRLGDGHVGGGARAMPDRAGLQGGPAVGVVFAPCHYGREACGSGEYHLGESRGRGRGTHAGTSAGGFYSGGRRTVAEHVAVGSGGPPGGCFSAGFRRAAFGRRYVRRRSYCRDSQGAYDGRVALKQPQIRSGCPRTAHPRHCHERPDDLQYGSRQTAPVNIQFHVVSF